MSILIIAAAVQAASPTASTCTLLSRNWQGVEQDLAENHAEGMADNSAPRATLRAQKETNSLMRSQIILGMMRESKCPLPKLPPSYATYLLSALTCRTDMMKNYQAKELPLSCKREIWTRMVE
jgi:hypothetical protein